LLYGTFLSPSATVARSLHNSGRHHIQEHHRTLVSMATLQAEKRKRLLHQPQPNTHAQYPGLHLPSRPLQFATSPCPRLIPGFFDSTLCRDYAATRRPSYRECRAPQDSSRSIFHCGRLFALPCRGGRSTASARGRKIVLDCPPRIIWESNALLSC
jgi:hypothetical protein